MPGYVVFLRAVNVGKRQLRMADARKVLSDNGFRTNTTDLRSAADAGTFYYAEDYHQQYLHKNPGGYCNHGPNGMTCPVGLVKQVEAPSQQDILPPTA